MARFKRLDTLNSIIRQGFVPVFYNPDIEKAKKILKACYDGGCCSVEFTNRGDMAVDVFRQMEIYAKETLPEMILGSGSISDEGTSSLFIQYGTNYVVSQYFDEKIAVICNKRKVPYMPGCGSLTEIHRAESFGVEICKMFPAMQIGGPAFVKAVLGPSPWTCIMPTGGVNPDEENLAGWFEAGVVCVGMGSKLIPSKIPDDFDYSEITSKIKKVFEIVKKVRKA